MALGASKPSQKDEFLCHRAWSRRLQRNLYFGGKSREDCSLPLTLMVSQVFSDRPGGKLRCLPVREAASVAHQASLTPAALVMAMVYLERLAASNAKYLRNADPKQLFVASTLAASKFLYDSGEEERTFNDEWADSADLEVEQLNAAERDFLAAMDWQLYVSGETFEAMLGRLEAAAALAESRRRGWLTYSDLVAVGSHTLISDTLALITDALIKVVAVCSVAYVASVLTLVSSVLLVFDVPTPRSPPLVFVARAPDSSQTASLASQLTAGLALLAALSPFHADVPESDVRGMTEEAEGTDIEDGWQRNETWERLLPDSEPARVPQRPEMMRVLPGAAEHLPRAPDPASRPPWPAGAPTAPHRPAEQEPRPHRPAERVVHPSNLPSKLTYRSPDLSSRTAHPSSGSRRSPSSSEPTDLPAHPPRLPVPDSSADGTLPWLGPDAPITLSRLSDDVLRLIVGNQRFHNVTNMCGWGVLGRSSGLGWPVPSAVVCR